jgi:hypothetical protein
MVEWLNKWQRWLHKPSKASDVPFAPGRWDLIQQQPPAWETSELALVYECERRTTLCTVTSEATGETLQTVVLGFEPAKHRLLLDEFFPSRQRPAAGEKFQVSLPSKCGGLILEVAVRNIISPDQNPAYVVEVLDKKRINDRRLQPRVTFDGHSGPSVDLLLPLIPAMRGRLLDLSAKGGAVQCFGPQKPQLYSRRGQCRIHFSDAFVLTADIQVAQVRFHKQPCRHMVFRTRFQQLPLKAQEQLLVFIHAYETLAGNAIQTH